MLKTYRSRPYPTKAQQAVLEGQLRLCRNLYDCALQERRDAYCKAGKTVTGTTR
ncbi:helix-turn-helix domain-containing protein (plasmid) [Deinococcus taeanensis]|uniref:helix-turn-helix domain-containing protein n=1 Tax=Deinococcus taeanensis TaxID=2737050 RepID=UPI001CDC0522|nr:helix-turn-helix domain-containing protein [Deinococcus taeanensis]UBV44712.1 helix-turn-helix domain-containing protein [Deinococcus taeanensis]